MSEEWHHSGSDCCSPLGLCCLSWWCPCFTHGRVAHRLHKDGNLQGHSACNWDCCAWYCLANVGCQWIVQMMQRGEIRSKYNLKGDGCTDCLCACCCSPCDLMQQEKEAEFREKQLLNGGAAVNVQPMKSDGGMVYQQQPQVQPAYQQQQQHEHQHQQPAYHPQQPAHPQQQPSYHQQQPAYQQQQPMYHQ